MLGCWSWGFIDGVAKIHDMKQDSFRVPRPSNYPSLATITLRGAISQFYGTVRVLAVLFRVESAYSGRKNVPHCCNKKRAYSSCCYCRAPILLHRQHRHITHILVLVIVTLIEAAEL